MFKMKNVELKYKYDYSEKPVKKYKLTNKELENYLNKFDNTQQIVQLKSSPIYKLQQKGVI